MHLKKIYFLLKTIPLRRNYIINNWFSITAIYILKINYSVTLLLYTGVDNIINNKLIIRARIDTVCGHTTN